MNETILITGISSGLGEGLCAHYLAKGGHVLALGRTKPETVHSNLHFIYADLNDHDSIPEHLKSLLADTIRIDVCILNAGIIGELACIGKTSLENIQKVMHLNTWSNKIILDTLISLNIPTTQIIGISSGASVSGSAGWGGYSLSKAALNMLIALYSHEMPNTHLCALAPGLVDTPMLRKLMEEGDEHLFPSVKRLKESKKFTPKEAASNIDSLRDIIMQHESGKYLDVRTLLSFNH